MAPRHRAEFDIDAAVGLVAEGEHIACAVDHHDVAFCAIADTGASATVACDGLKDSGRVRGRHLHREANGFGLGEQKRGDDREKGRERVEPVRNALLALDKERINRALSHRLPVATREKKREHVAQLVKVDHRVLVLVEHIVGGQVRVHFAFRERGRCGLRLAEHCHGAGRSGGVHEHFSELVNIEHAITVRVVLAQQLGALLFAHNRPADGKVLNKLLERDQPIAVRVREPKLRRLHEHLELGN
eukprot:Amastigsp_a340013_118.p2 type:complete len:245 gc:universal Amastigsp_a340013_118:451-1185(+)